MRRSLRWVLLGTVAAIAVTTGVSAAGGLTTLYQLMFKQTGTSAVARTARSKVADFVSVMDFGATGNGVTNDTVAVTAAIAYAGSFVNVYFPCPGTYQTTTWGTIPCGYETLVASTGAVPRPLGTKIAEWLSAKDFGAVGNGVTDDTAAIGNLLNAASSTQLINLPCPGTYVTSTYGTLACGVYYPPLVASGAVVRAVSNKVLDNISVRDFGAKADGTTDDTSAIQNALTAGVSKCVDFPVGTYKITGSLTVASNNCIRGAGIGSTIIDATSFTVGKFVFTASGSISNVHIIGFTVNGPGVTVDTRGVSVICDGCVIEYNKFYNFFDGIDLLATSTNSIVQFNTVSTMGQQGITGIGDYNQFIGNRVDTVGTTNLHHGLYIQTGDGSVIAQNQISNITGFCIHNFTLSTSGIISNTRIVNNYCKTGGTAGSGTRGGIAFAETSPATGVRQGEIIGNEIDATNGNPIYVSAAQDVVVEANTIRNYQGDALNIQSASGYTTERISVRGNHVYNGTSTGSAIRVNINGGTAIKNITVDGNIVDTTVSVGIWLQGVTDSIVSHNRVKDYNSGAAASNSGIRIESTSLRNLIQGNNIATANVTNSPPAIHVVAAADADNTIADNYVINNAATITDGGTRTIIRGNKVNITDAVFAVGSGGFSTTGNFTLSGYIAAADRIFFSLRTPVADTNATAGTSYLIAYTTLTATRVVTLPACSGNSGMHLVIKDESGSAAAGVKIQATGAGANTLDGVAAGTPKDLIISAYGAARLYCNGTNWFTM